MHLHRQVVVLGADVLGQQVDGLGTSVADTDLRSGKKNRGLSSSGRLVYNYALVQPNFNQSDNGGG